MLLIKVLVRSLSCAPWKSKTSIQLALHWVPCGHTKQISSVSSISCTLWTWKTQIQLVVFWYLWVKSFLLGCCWTERGPVDWFKVSAWTEYIPYTPIIIQKGWGEELGACWIHRNPAKRSQFVCCLCSLHVQKIVHALVAGGTERQLIGGVLVCFPEVIRMERQWCLPLFYFMLCAGILQI
jgi:hypothetical protein